MNPVFNRLLFRGRTRFNEVLLLSRQEGMRRIVKALKDGYPFYYLPDMDFGILIRLTARLRERYLASVRQRTDHRSVQGQHG